MATKDNAVNETPKATDPKKDEPKKDDGMPLSTEHPRAEAGAAEPSAEMKELQAANVEVAEAEKAAADAGKSNEEKKLEEARAKAGKARAKAAEADERGRRRTPHTVAEAGTLVVADPKMKAGDHFAQKFGNDPENPKLADGVVADQNLVLLSRQTPDVPGKVYTEVPKEMVGDYERAGWNRDVG